MPLVDLRLTTIEPVDIRGAIYADDVQGKTVWFPPEFLPAPDQPAGILFLDELTAADQRLQISAYSLILDRRVGHYRLPDGWQVVAAGNASFHGAVSHDMGTALADRMFHFNVQTVIDAFLAHALAHGFAPEVMAYLQGAARQARRHAGAAGRRPPGRRQPARLGGHLQRAASRACPTRPSACFVQGRIGAANAAEFFGVLREIQAGVDVLRLLAARARRRRPRRCCRARWTALYGMVYGLLAACSDATTLARALEIVEQLPEVARRSAAADARGADAGDGAAAAARAGARPGGGACSTAPPTAATPSARRCRGGSG